MQVQCFEFSTATNLCLPISLPNKEPMWPLETLPSACSMVTQIRTFAYNYDLPLFIDHWKIAGRIAYLVYKHGASQHASLVYREHTTLANGLSLEALFTVFSTTFYGSLLISHVNWPPPASQRRARRSNYGCRQPDHNRWYLAVRIPPHSLVHKVSERHPLFCKHLQK